MQDRRNGKIYRDEEQSVPYYVTGNTWVGYDDVYSVKNKVSHWIISISVSMSRERILFCFFSTFDYYYSEFFERQNGFFKKVMEEAWYGRCHLMTSTKCVQRLLERIH